MGLAGQLDALEDSLLQSGHTNQEVRQARRLALAEMIDTDETPDSPGEANLNRAQQMFKQPADDKLVSFFTERTDVMHAILGDVYIVTEYEERKERGEGRDGRRTMPFDANLDRLWEMTTPRYSMNPFGLAVRELIGERSLRQFAAKVPMDHRELSRMLRGQSHPSMYHLEQIAKAGKVAPAFFLEYRIAYVVASFQRVFAAKPNLSIGVFKKITGIEG